MAGRPPFEWTQEIEDEILNRIGDGEAIRNICGTGRDDWLPSWPTVNKRLAEDAEFASRYARAREAQADKLFDECLAIADSQEGDVITVDGVEQVNHDAIQRARLRIDTRKWMAGKLRPKVYGDKIELDNKHSLSDPLQDLLAEIAASGKRIGV